MYLLSILVTSLLVFLLWLVISSPLLLVFYLAARWMKRRGWRSEAAYVGLAALAACVAAPVPTPIITIFVPLVWALVDPSYAEGWAAFPGALAPWVTTSVIATFVAAYVVVKLIVRPPAPRNEADEVKG